MFSVLQFFGHDFSCSHFFPSQSQPSMSSGDTVRLQWWYNSTTSVDVTIYTNMFTWSASCSFNMDAFVLQQNSMRLSESNTLHHKVISQLKIVYYIPLFCRKSFASLKEDNAPSVDTVEQKKTRPAMTQYSGPPSISEGMETGVWACISQRGPSTLYPVNDSKNSWWENQTWFQRVLSRKHRSTTVSNEDQWVCFSIAYNAMPKS